MPLVWILSGLVCFGPRIAFQGQTITRPTIGPGSSTEFRPETVSPEASSNCRAMNVAVESLSITVAGGRKLLNEVNCVVQAGDMVALMGPSGAGKTTLLNSIVGRTISGLTEGGIYYDGATLSKVRQAVITLANFCLDVHLNGVRGLFVTCVVSSFEVQTLERSSVGYVTQDDIMYETLTPRENLTFAAAFILPKLSKESRQKEVDDE